MFVYPENMLCTAIDHVLPNAVIRPNEQEQGDHELLVGQSQPFTKPTSVCHSESYVACPALGTWSCLSRHSRESKHTIVAIPPGWQAPFLLSWAALFGRIRLESDDGACCTVALRQSNTERVQIRCKHAREDCSSVSCALSCWHRGTRASGTPLASL